MNIKKTLITVAQAAITLGILAWLFRNPERNREMWTAFTGASLGWVLLAVLMLGLVEVCAVVRWKILMDVQDLRLGWKRLTDLTMIGLFFNILMPGGTGGDVVKIFYLIKETPGKKGAAMLAAVMDRVLGLMAMMTLGGIMIALRYDWLTATKATSGLLLLLLGVFGSALSFLIISLVVTMMGWVNKLPERMPMRQHVVDLCAAYSLYGRAWKATLAAFLVSIPVHLCSFAVFYCVARSISSISDKVFLWDFLTITPIVNTLSAMPTSLGGVGVREGLFVQFLGLCGIDTGMATVISLMGYGVIFFWGLVGGIFYLFYRPSGGVSLEKMEAAVAKAEGEISPEQ